ncbi:eukaryotic translation initiation factor 2-alpha kinase 1-like isoform X2 [Myxocyprinus asiaticus]|uniref:eukaryotic translation initiation factor 2-alpha kinase 1-like isoform X2 n=1 Tax=Myxocyprinus asiaticus TaxID=70543 RepID=UPI002222437A|nr:eukaryotic translation initiation factor 2-alpha kinase 1-like isoform X2 [Myxocyprinus asiaticus]
MAEESSSSSVVVKSRSLQIQRGLFTQDRGSRGGMFSLTDTEDDVQFDTSDSDNNCEVLLAGKKYPSIQEFASAIPNQLLLGSLLEHLCFVYESDPTRSHMLFKVIGQRLAAMNLLSPLAIGDEFSTVRLQHNRAFTELLHATSSSLFPQDHRYLSTEGQTLRTKDGLFQAQTSRYLSEFEEITTLGKGSYGKVFKVTNKLDGQEYAVKKILIKKVTRDDCMKVLREVKVLSSLQHQNIVGYHTAWMEHIQPVVRNPKSLVSQTFPALEKPSQKEGCTQEITDGSSGSSIVFEHSDQQKDKENQVILESISVKPSTSKEEMGHAVCPKNIRSPQNFVPCVFLGKPRTTVNKCPAAKWDSSTLSEDDLSQNRLELNNNSYLEMDSPEWSKKQAHEVQFHLMLYIQMQLCERSLKDWIQERNSRIMEELSVSVDPCDSVECEQVLKILKKILEGVEYIHSRGIMHRDLKPRNIFLHGPECHVKIGDFGLACKNIVMDEHEQLPSNSQTDSTHTSGVGTFVYAAPEQLKGSRYDSKSDMYSIGVIAFELFQPFGTEMERVHTLEELRKGQVPNTLSKNGPVLTKYIRLLTSSDPSMRPSASQLLQSDIFSTNDMVIHSLKCKIEEQEEEIFQLRRKISELQISQNAIHNPEKT